jgi:nitrogen fixation NifU-like protein
MYSEKVMDHFQNPRNVGEIPDADGIGKVGNPTCGDLMYIYIKVKDGILEDVKFKTFGCGAAIATSSMLTELAKGKSLEEAEKITRDQIADELDGLPPVKMHCSNLAADGLLAAIEDYKARQAGEDSDGKNVNVCATCHTGPDEAVCHPEKHIDEDK